MHTAQNTKLTSTQDVYEKTENGTEKKFNYLIISIKLLRCQIWELESFILVDAPLQLQI